MKLRKRPIAAVLVEAALTGFTGNISIAGSTAKESIAIDIHMDDGIITHCAGYLGDTEVSGDGCVSIVMSAECVNCGAELTKLTPDKIIREFRRPILLREPLVSDRIDTISELFRRRVRSAEIILKGRMMIFVKARVEEGLKALTELSTNNVTAMLATVNDTKLVVASRKGKVMAAYLRLDGNEYIGLKALSKATQELKDPVLIQIYSLPEEIGSIFNDKIDANDTE